MRTETIPPRSQKVIDACVYSIGNIMKTPFNFGNGLLVGNTISKVSNNKAELLLLNYSHKPIVMAADTQSASYESSEQREAKEQVNLVATLGSTDETINVGSDLTDKEISQLRLLLNKYIETFAIDRKIGRTNIRERKIELEKDAKLFAEPLRRRAQVQMGIIEESDLPWASAYVLAKKKNGEMRLCVDFRRLNDLTKKTVFVSTS